MGLWYAWRRLRWRATLFWADWSPRRIKTKWFICGVFVGALVVAMGAAAGYALSGCTGQSTFTVGATIKPDVCGTECQVEFTWTYDPVKAKLYAAEQAESEE